MRRLVLTLGLVIALVGLVPTPSQAADPPTVTAIAARSGPLRGGDLVTVLGTGFTGATAVVFGGTSSSTDLQVVSDTHLQVRTPAHAIGGTYVQVVRPDATSAQTRNGVYDYVDPPAPLRFGPIHTRAANASHHLDCASASLCADAGGVATDSRGQIGGADIKNGSTWSAPKQFAHNIEMTGASCTLTPRRQCMVVASNGYSYRWDGRWHALQVASSNNGYSLVDVSCATSSFCMAVSGPGYAYRWNGTRWSGPTHLTSELDAVSCPTTTFCYAVGQGSALGVRWVGSRWGTPASIGTGGPTEISCSSSTFCMAGGDFGSSGGNRLEFTGTAWSPPNTDNGPGELQGATQNDVTCTGPLFCVNPNGHEETEYHFTTYDGDTVDDSTSTFADPISCWAAYQCMTVAGHSWRYITQGE